jgi:hypothetical protein
VPHEMTNVRWPAVLAWCAVAPLVAGLLMEVVTLARPKTRLRTGGRWLIAAGAFAGLPAATVGLWETHEVVRAAAGEGAPGRPVNRAWYSLARAADLGRVEWEAIRWRAWRTTGGVLVTASVVATYWAASDRWRRRVYPAGLLLVLGAAAVLTTDAARRGVAGEVGTGGETRMMLHAALGGTVVALATAAIAVSSRAADSSPADESSDAVVRQRRVRPRGFWTALLLATIAAVVSGFAVAGWRWRQLGELLQQPRDRAHVAAGVVVVAVAAWAGLVRDGRRGLRGRRLAACAALIALALVAGVATGALMLFDGSDGGSELFRLRRPAVQVPGRD